MAMVETVRGAIDTADLGPTYMHEHVFVLDPDVQQNYPAEWFTRLPLQSVDSAPTPPEGTAPPIRLSSPGSCAGSSTPRSPRWVLRAHRVFRTERRGVVLAGRCRDA